MIYWHLCQQGTALCKKCRVADCLGKGFRKKIGNGQGARITAGPSHPTVPYSISLRFLFNAITLEDVRDWVIQLILVGETFSILRRLNNVGICMNVTQHQARVHCNPIYKQNCVHISSYNNYWDWLPVTHKCRCTTLSYLYYLLYKCVEAPWWYRSTNTLQGFINNSLSST